MSRTSFTAAILAALFSLPAFALDLIYTAPPLTEVQRERLVKNLDRRWENLQKKSPNMGVREMFGFSLDSAEADYRLDRIDG
ncbi:MAG: hypothetical protein FJ272_10055, partial [Planctomycetes bacterium]|nr:hypothetical protein [Planctomycetota bacterium]